MSVVIDASVALCWCFDDESSPRTEALLDRVARDGALVPILWYFELGNVLLQAERRGRIKTADVAARLELIGALPIVTDQDSAGRIWREVLALARSHRLTTYDAAYLDLAIHRAMPLATNDGDLIKAAKSVGVELV